MKPYGHTRKSERKYGYDCADIRELAPKGFRTRKKRATRRYFKRKARAEAHQQIIEELEDEEENNRKK